MVWKAVYVKKGDLLSASAVFMVVRPEEPAGQKSERS